MTDNRQNLRSAVRAAITLTVARNAERVRADIVRSGRLRSATALM